jgi:4-hydroxybenzoate polyprenyltransferase
VPQAFLGLAFGWAIPMAFAAQTGEVPRIAWLLLIANVLWTTAYDTIYAMMDREDDIRIGVKSTAILFGQGDIMAVRILHLLFFATMILIGRQLEFGWYFYGGLIAAALLSFYQFHLLGERDETYYFKAFLNNNWFGAAIFAGIGLEYYFR